MPLWVVPELQVRLSITGIGKKSDMSSSVLRKLYLFYITEMYGEASHVFIDELVTASSSAAAVVMPGQELIQSF